MSFKSGVNKLILIAAALFVIPAYTCPGHSEEKPSLKVEDVIKRETLSEFDISPDGNWAAWVKSEADSKSNRRARKIVVKSLAGEAQFTLSASGSDSYTPRFSPDGSAICFIRKMEKGKSQIYRYRMAGGDSKKLTSVQNGVRDFKWLRGGKIIYSAREDSTYRERSLKDREDDTVIVADQEHYPPVRLFILDPASGKTARLSENSGQIVEFSPSPDGKLVVYNLNIDVDYSYDHRTHPRQYLLELSAQEARAAGPPREIFTEPFLNPYRYRWSGPGEFYCVRNISSDSTDTYVSIRRLYHYSVADDRISRAGISDLNGLGGAFFIVEDGLVADLAAGTRYRNIFARVEKGGITEYPLESESGRPLSIQCGRGRDIIYLVGDGSTVPSVRHGVLRRGKLQPRDTLYTLNKDYRNKFLARSEVIRWTGALNQEVEGILYYPRGYREGSSFPLVVSLHGGPSGYDMDFFSERWSNYPHTLAGKGAMVLKVNYHGSGNYGLDWIESIRGHYYEYEVPDILSGVENLIEKGIADSSRIGIMGWSNGSILAIACCLESDIFKSLCAGAGDVNWTSDYGNCRFGAGFDNAYFGGPPWELTETYIRKSPLFRMDQLETPTLIMFGSRDRAVPTEQGWQHFRAMQQIGKAPVRFILFPGAGHGPDKLSHQRRKMKEELAWMDRHLFEAPRDTIEVVPPQSPLSLRLSKLEAARTGRLFGTERNGVLIPETLPGEELAFGRFEVTRAQFREFNRKYTFREGTGNYPASGISFREASRYCEWLSEKTGDRYFLPSEEQMEKLLEAASPSPGSENNLAYWAGYIPTPDEERKLLNEISALGGRGALLTETGSFPAADGGYYDLAGNVAEWVSTRKGGSRAFGLSAVSNPDTRAADQVPPDDYTGFRVYRKNQRK